MQSSFPCFAANGFACIHSITLKFRNQIFYKVCQRFSLGCILSVLKCFGNKAFIYNVCIGLVKV